MIHLPPLRTKRLNVRMQELSIGAGIGLAAIAPSRHEYATSEFLRAVVPAEDGDVRLWSVQERMLAVCHYLAATAPNGESDFAVGQTARLTDYLDTGRDYLPSVSAGQACGDTWTFVPLTGMAAEAIEQLAPSTDDRAHWLMGMMAAQLLRIDQQGAVVADDLAPQDDSGFGQWLRQRMNVLSQYPQSDFVELLEAFYRGEFEARHFFAVEPGADGILALPKGGEAILPPARFPVGECVSPVAKRLAERVPVPGA